MSGPAPLAALRAFEATARHLSFLEASVELAVTPTAISHHVRQLEAHCGVLLFRRRPRPIVLTPAGKALFPVVRDAFRNLTAALDRLQDRNASQQLRVTTTNAIAARWLVPRLSDWRATHPALRLDIVGTDAVLDLDAGEADVAIRYARLAPSQFRTIELLRDRFFAVASPSLVGSRRLPLSPSQLARLPLIEADWPAHDVEAPTWRKWEKVARAVHGDSRLRLNLQAVLSFREELHAIEATIAGQGVMLCSDVLVAPEIRAGKLVRLSEIGLDGYGFYLTCTQRHSRLLRIRTFERWLTTLVRPA